MKILTALSLLLLSTPAFATMPFTFSGQKIQAIFDSPLIWKKIGGEVQKISFVQIANKTTRYAVSTIEYVAIKNENGAVIGSKALQCNFTADVTAGGDYLAPTWSVTQTDFSGCQL